MEMRFTSEYIHIYSTRNKLSIFDTIFHFPFKSTWFAFQVLILSSCGFHFVLIQLRANCELSMHIYLEYFAERRRIIAHRWEEVEKSSSRFILREFYFEHFATVMHMSMLHWRTKPSHIPYIQACCDITFYLYILIILLYSNNTSVVTLEPCIAHMSNQKMK